MTISWHGASGDDARPDRLGDGAGPDLVDLVEGAAHADAIDLAARRQHADRDGDVIFAALGIDDVAEEERLAVLLGDAAAELPAHQRVHLAVLVDRAIDGDEQPGLLERLQMVVQIGIAALRHRFVPSALDEAGRGGRHVVHRITPARGG